MYQINSDAIFVADSHYSYKNQQLFALLEDLQKSPPSQIFLLGDIFDFLANAPRASGASRFSATNKITIMLRQSLRYI
jgi:UDP-2,3-diacylglucosamine pyrophosphatase LpxH